MAAGPIELIGDETAVSNGAALYPSIDEVERSIRQRGEAALRWLVEAHSYAASLAQDVWQFALAFPALNRGGLSPGDLRWLLYRRHLLHARETTLPSEERRRFRSTGVIRFDGRSCFVLTEAGLHFTSQGVHVALVNGLHFAVPVDSLPQAGQPPARDELTPVWDRDRQELRLGRELVKCYKTPAPNQELILAAFQEEGWPVHIFDPLPPHPEQDPRRRLHDTINSLNRHQKRPLIRFMGDGSGQGVRWDLNPPRRAL